LIKDGSLTGEIFALPGEYDTRSSNNDTYLYVAGPEAIPTEYRRYEGVNFRTTENYRWVGHLRYGIVTGSCSIVRSHLHGFRALLSCINEKTYANTMDVATRCTERLVLYSTYYGAVVGSYIDKLSHEQYSSYDQPSIRCVDNSYIRYQRFLSVDQPTDLSNIVIVSSLTREIAHDSDLIIKHLIYDNDRIGDLSGSFASNVGVTFRTCKLSENTIPTAGETAVIGVVE